MHSDIQYIYEIKHTYTSKQQAPLLFHNPKNIVPHPLVLIQPYLTGLFEIVRQFVQNHTWITRNNCPSIRLNSQTSLLAFEIIKTIYISLTFHLFLTLYIYLSQIRLVSTHTHSLSLFQNILFNIYLFH